LNTAALSGFLVSYILQFLKENFSFQLNVISAMPRLEVKLSNIPESLYSGEVKSVALQFNNTGANGLSNLFLVSSFIINPYKCKITKCHFEILRFIIIQEQWL
jgi:hypothetical protein